MKTLLIAGTLLVVAASAPSTSSATGRGSMTFGHEDEGRAWFRFSVQEGDPAAGSLTFAAEHHHDDHSMLFPDIVVTLGTFDTVKFDAASVEFSGPGKYHDDDVDITVRAVDKTDKADRFIIKCKDGKGKVVFEADGTLFRGDVAIKTDGGGE
jgi:hypothetical protein